MSKMINCKSCGTEIAASAKTCPSCGAKNKKPIYKRAWFIVLIVIAVIVIACSAGGSDEPSGDVSETNKNEAKQEITYTAYDVDQLVDDLEENAMKASDTYLDQYVELTGRLCNIDSSGSYFSIEPVNNEFSFMNVQCYIQNQEQEDIVKELSMGDVIAVKGKITDVGEIMGYSLDIDSISAE